jgi:hypothetical protein
VTLWPRVLPPAATAPNDAVATLTRRRRLHGTILKITLRRTKQVSTIFRNLQNAHAAVVNDTMKGGDLGARIGALAIKAVTGGLTSPDWKTYMSLFADNVTQLNRLTTTTTDGNRTYLPQFRAYIAGNGVCDAATTTDTANKLDVTIDDGLDPNLPADDTVNQRPFQIPVCNCQ